MLFSIFKILFLKHIRNISFPKWIIIFLDRYRKNTRGEHDESAHILKYIVINL